MRNRSLNTYWLESFLTWLKLNCFLILSDLYLLLPSKGVSVGFASYQYFVHEDVKRQKRSGVEPGTLWLCEKSFSCLPTGSVKVECSPPEREVVSCESQPSHIKDLKNGNRYTQLSAKLESDIDNPERWLSSGRMLCVNNCRVQMGNETAQDQKIRIAYEDVKTQKRNGIERETLPFRYRCSLTKI